MNRANLFHPSDTPRFTESPWWFPLRVSVRALGVSLALLFILLFVSGCRDTEIKPVDIAAEDVCMHCKMAISEKQFAAEFVTPEGDAVKFDDIGCMLGYLKEKPDTRVAAYFFAEYDTKKWLNGNATTFVKSKEISSPMSGGIIAFENAIKAKTAAAEYSGQLLSFSELIKK